MPLYHAPGVTLNTAQTITGAKTFSATTVITTLRAPADETTALTILNSVGQAGIVLPGGYTAHKVRLDNGLRILPAATNTSAIDMQLLASQTAEAITVSDNLGGTLFAVLASGRIRPSFAEGMRTLELGAADSAGAGFRTVRVPN